jgi:Leucine-rich repeat (LRR) protein
MAGDVVELNGTISTHIGVLYNLKEFSVASLAVHGTLPSQLSSMPLLEKLTIDSTSISGAFPPMPHLRTLFMSRTLITELPFLPQLTSLAAQHSALRRLPPMSRALRSIKVQNSPNLTGAIEFVDDVGNAVNLLEVFDVGFSVVFAMFAYAVFKHVDMT